MKTIAFIPIRNGSKGIPGKNIRPLGGKQLVCWTIDTLLLLSGIDQIWVSTDSEEAIGLLKSRYGNKIGVFHRNPKNAGDHSPVIEAVIELINALQVPGDSKFILAQATSPFTTVEDFSKLLECIHNEEADSYISCQRVKKFTWSEDGKPLNYDMNTKPMRQDYPGILLETGAFYASSVNAILQSGQSLSGRIKVIETGLGTSIDIDEEKDWIDAEHYIQDNGLQ